MRTRIQRSDTAADSRPLPARRPRGAHEPGDAGPPVDEPAAHRALLELLAFPALGRAWLIEADGRPVGYVALTLGFSLEYGGRDAFVDELFVQPGYRRRGFGRAALAFAVEEASRLGVQAVHLEVERANPAAHDLYRSLGFGGNDRLLLTRRLARRG